MCSDQHQCLIPSGDSGYVSDRRLHNVSGSGYGFVKGAPITIYHGKDGEDGKDGENGVDGSDGTDGYTQKISAAEKVRDEEGSVTFVLHDGGTIVIPKMGEFNLLFEEPSEIMCEAGVVVRVAYRVVGGDGDITVECFDNNGYSAVIEPADYNHGYVAVSVPSHVVSGKVLVYAYDATGRTVMRAPVFEEGVLVGMPEIHEIGGEAQSPSPNTQRAPTAKPPSPSSTATRSCSRFGRFSRLSPIHRFSSQMSWLKYVLLEDPAVNLDGDNEIIL